ncbi:tyrosine-type recombinase/integrase [Paraclostridium sordellii]|uniref:tyrosine-type recombinase/integrase n=1 Tax=Paraclostridium sordellii TaxID=1505 RepID=UPI0005DFEC1A|nr:tyrosine-type recombinase/integrase [Paeniclostridium sordellii]CEP39685.1 tyrosine recombinase XerC [[Clostridium] sordellii] [Paeniclostridium sordellii]
MQLKEIIEEFLLELDIRGASKETIRSYTNSLKVFSDYIGEIEVEKIKAVHIKGFAKFNKDRGLKQKTQNGYISAVRALYSYMIEEEIVTKNLGYSVKLVNATDKKEIDIFTSEEIKKLVAYKKMGTQKDNKYIVARDNLIINFLLETGCRNHELTNLKDSDIEDGYIFFKVTKNSKPRVVPISKQLKKLMNRYERVKKQYFKKNNKEDIMNEYYFLSRTGGKLFTSNIGQVVKGACKNLDISVDKAYPHNFRHTFAVNMLKNTKDVYLVSKLLGHCNVSITEEYLRGLTKLDILEMSKGCSILENL